MNEDQNMPEENSKEEMPILNDDEVSENISSAETIEQTQPETQNAKPETENMEVHHHPHVDKKNFKEYLLEGLMIFLAVTMGFIAENIRENISENKIAGELAESLYKEVLSDSVNIHNSIDDKLNIKEKDINHFIDYLRDSSLTNPSESFYTSAFAGFLYDYHFEPKDGILNQLRNSGSLRYFKSTDLQEDIGALSVAISNIKTRNAVEEQFLTSIVRPFLLKHFNFTWLESTLYYPEKKPLNLQILNFAEFKKLDAINIATEFLMINRSTCDQQYKKYTDINHRLLETLRKEYSVKNE